MFHLYGLMIGVGVVLAITLAERILKNRGEDPGIVWEAGGWMVVPAIVGARVYHVIDQWEYYKLNLGEVVAVWQGGVAIWGAILGGAVGLLIFAYFHARRKDQKIEESFFAVADVVAIVLPLAQAIGRIGNYLNDELWGRMSIWGFKHPIFLYEGILNLVLAGLLYILFQKQTGRGRTTGGYLLGYGAIRVILEPLRQEVWRWRGIDVAMSISIFAIVVGLLLLLRRRKYLWQ
ncbi:MAG: prolipoprotein diacylglyceryl transferase [bacterium]